MLRNTWAYLESPFVLCAGVLRTKLEDVEQKSLNMILR